jgi:DNA-binding transcriptional regulator YdaS (Cro superfamily)
MCAVYTIAYNVTLCISVALAIRICIPRIMTDAMTCFEALIACRDAAGSDSALARDLSDEIVTVSQPRVWRWVNQARQMPAEFVLKAERLYGVSRHLLRPDIYPVEAIEASAPRWAGIDHGAGLRIQAVDRTALRVAFNSGAERKDAAA